MPLVRNTLMNQFHTIFWGKGFHIFPQEYPLRDTCTDTLKRKSLSWDDFVKFMKQFWCWYLIYVNNRSDFSQTTKSSHSSPYLFRGNSSPEVGRGSTCIHVFITLLHVNVIMNNVYIILWPLWKFKCRAQFHGWVWLTVPWKFLVRRIWLT